VHVLVPSQNNFKRDDKIGGIRKKGSRCSVSVSLWQALCEPISELSLIKLRAYFLQNAKS
jgi:hypothetical protein